MWYEARVALKLLRVYCTRRSYVRFRVYCRREGWFDPPSRSVMFFRGVLSALGILLVPRVVRYWLEDLWLGR